MKIKLEVGHILFMLRPYTPTQNKLHVRKIPIHHGPIERNSVAPIVRPPAVKQKVIHKVFIRDQFLKVKYIDYRKHLEYFQSPIFELLAFDGRFVTMQLYRI